jgi:outer membrane protein assembly factor BamB
MISNLRTTCYVALLLASLAPSSQADWPAFLGGTERNTFEGNIPTKWSPTENVKWTQPLVGYGQSSPIVVGDTIYLTAIEGPNKETNWVVALDLATGKEKWKHSIVSSLTAKNDPYTSRAAPTPVADAEGVIALFESGDIVALSSTGSVRWERKLIDDYGQIVGRFGLGGSLAQIEDRVFALVDNDGPSYLLAMEKSTGAELWKTDRSSRIAWSSPMMLDVDGKPQIVVSSAGSVDGYDPADGDLLWSIDDVGGNTVASPVPFGNGRFLVGASPGRNGEAADGAKRSNMAVEVVAKEGGYEPKILWRNEVATSSFGSPIEYKGKAYYVNRAGGMFCIDAATGELLYKSRINESNWATPLGIEDRVYFFGQKGSTTVIEDAAEYTELAINRLFDEPADGGGPGGFNAEIQYGVALTKQGLLVRTGENLYLVGE